VIEGLAPALAWGLVVFVLYRKLRRAFARQRVRPMVLVLKITLCTTVAILLAGSLALSGPGFLAAGPLGGALAWLAVSRMRVEHEDGVGHYTPKPLIGLTVFALFLGRLAYRLISLGPLSEFRDLTPTEMQAHMLEGQGNPLTRALLLLLLSYYACFFTGVLVRSRRSRLRS
jgi:hypothetical protein